MATRTATVTLTGGPLRFEAVVGSGHTFVFDLVPGGSVQGELDQVVPDEDASETVDGGPRPDEVMGAALGACTAMEVLAILRAARQDVRRYEVRVTGDEGDERPRDPARFDVVHVVDGNGLNPEALRRAIERSTRRYCALGRTLAPRAVEVHHAYLLRDDAGDERYAELLVLDRDGRLDSFGDRPRQAEASPPSGG